MIQGYEWEEGEVRTIVSKLIEKYKDTPHQEEYTYSGPDVGMWIESITSSPVESMVDLLIGTILSFPSAGEIAYRVQNVWENLPPLYPPEYWSGAPPPGFEGAMGMRLHNIEPWRPVSCLHYYLPIVLAPL
jgi:hypothetical protein